MTGPRIAGTAGILCIAALLGQCAAHLPVPTGVPAEAPVAAPATPVAAPADPPTLAPEPRGLFIVRVTDSSGDPVAGAKVYASTRDGTDATAESDAAGIVRLELRRGDGDWVRAEDDRGRATHWVSVQSIGDGGEADLVLVSGALLAVTVVEAGSKEPLAGAEVTILEGGTTAERADAFFRIPTANGKTRASGIFGPIPVARDGVMTIHARAPGHCFAERSIDIPGKGPFPPVSMELEIGGVIAGTVRAPDGTPVPGATVNILPGPGDDSEDGAAWGLWTEDTYGVLATQADGSGAYRIDRVPVGGSYVVQANAEGWTNSLPLHPVVVTADRPAATADPVLRKSASLVIRVLSPTGRLVENARVERIIDRRWTMEVDPLRPDSPGEFGFDSLGPGTLTIVVTARGFAPARAEIALAEGEARIVDLYLSEGAILRGVVVDQEGRPVENVQVILEPAEWDPAWFGISDFVDQMTDAEGRFELRDLRRIPCVVRAEGSDRGRVEADVLPWLTPPPEDLVLRLVPPPPKTMVRFQLTVPPGAEAPKTLQRFGVTHNWRQGRFEVDTPPGEGKLRYFARGFAPLEIPYRVGEGQTLDLGEFLLDSGVDITGRVLDPSGSPVVGAVVRLDQMDSQGDPTSIADADGRFRIEHAARGENHLIVRREHFLDGRFTLPGTGGEGPTDLVLRRGALVRVRVETSAGLPAPGVDVLFIPAKGDGDDRDSNRESTDARCRCDLRVRAGPWTVRAHDDGYEGEVVLAEGAVVNLRIVLK